MKRVRGLPPAAPSTMEEAAAQTALKMTRVDRQQQDPAAAAVLPRKRERKPPVVFEAEPSAIAWRVYAEIHARTGWSSRDVARGRQKSGPTATFPKNLRRAAERATSEKHSDRRSSGEGLLPHAQPAHSADEVAEKERALDARRRAKQEREHAISLMSFAASEPSSAPLRQSKRKITPPKTCDATPAPKVHIAYKERRAALMLFQGSS